MSSPFCPVARKPLLVEKNTSTVLLINNDGVIKCRSNGIPLANNTWTKDGLKITFHKSAKYSILENQDLVINKVTNADAGVYECTARNVFGEDKRTIDVDIGKMVTDLSFVLPMLYEAKLRNKLNNSDRLQWIFFGQNV